jgi:hypothetical protein
MRKLLVLIAAASMLTACGSSSAIKPPVARELPKPPSYMQEVHVPEPKEGEDLLVVATRERRGRLKANKIIKRSRAAWGTMRATYKRGK